MKKIFAVFIGILCLFMTACSNEFAKQEYDVDEKISQGDRYAKEMSVFNTIDGGYSLTAAKFDGRETLWTKTLEEDLDLEINIGFSLSNGRAKIVYVDDKGNVTALVECTPDNLTNGYITKNISLKAGQNELKIVGYDCEDVDLKMLFEEP